MRKGEILAINILSGLLAGTALGIIEVLWESHKTRKAGWALATEAETAANAGSND